MVFDRHSLVLVHGDWVERCGVSEADAMEILGESTHESRGAPSLLSSPSVNSIGVVL